MVLSVKYHQTALSGAYVADTCKLRGWCLCGRHHSEVCNPHSILWCDRELRWWVAFPWSIWRSDYVVRSRGGEGAAIAIQTVVSFCGCSFIRLVIFDLISEWFCFLLLLENIYRVVYDVGDHIIEWGEHTSEWNRSREAHHRIQSGSNPHIRNPKSEIRNPQFE